MQSIERPRQYVSPARLYAMFPVLRFSYERGAYVLRVVGESRGPVLRKNRRRRQRVFAGADRRAGAVDLLASRPVGNVRLVKAPGGERTDGGRTDAARADAARKDATRKDATRTDATRTDAARADAVSPEPPPPPARAPTTSRSRAARPRAPPRGRRAARQQPPR